MPRTVPLVQRIEIASPCSARWEDMAGDERVRFCGDCRMNVYNVAELSADEVRTLVEETEGRLCARIYRRADGMILTKDCPVGLAAARRHVRRLAAAICAGLAMLFGGLAFARSGSSSDGASAPPCTSLGTAPGVRTVKRWLDPAPPAVNPAFMMGEVMVMPQGQNGTGP